LKLLHTSENATVSVSRGRSRPGVAGAGINPVDSR